MRPIKAAFVGFGEVNTPREFIDDRCDEAARLLEKEGVEMVTTAPVADDPEGNDVFYKVSWGDGFIDGFVGPYASGEEVTLSHAWH